MNQYSTRQAATKLGLSLISVQRYIARGKIPAPAVTRVGGSQLRIWTDKDIEKVRKVLPTIKNGRKTRYQEKHSAVSTQQSAKPKPKSKTRREKSKRKKD